QLWLERFKCFQADGHGVMRGPMLIRLGMIHHELGDYAAADAYLRQGMAILAVLGDNVRVCSVLTQLGCLAMAQDKNEEAKEHLTKALALIRITGHLLNRIAPLDALGRLAQRQGDYARARTLHQESLALAVEMEHPA